LNKKVKLIVVSLDALITIPLSVHMISSPKELLLCMLF